MRLLLLASLFGSLCLAPAQDGLLPSWEVTELSEGIVKNTESVKTILDQVRPKEWIQQGAPDAYVAQLESLRTDLENLKLSSEALGRKPEQLTRAIETFLWLDRLDSQVRSIGEGVRHYQNPSLASLLDSARGHNNAAVEKLKGYMRDLAVQVEEQMEIAHEEAQRCRSNLLTKPRGRN
jgi:hypothetical protein